MNIIIDGYNLIFQCGLQSNPASSDPLRLHRARQRLVADILRNVSRSTAQQIQIVFDAAVRPVRAESNRENIGGITIFYADEFEDADTMIEHLISKHPTPKKLVVVSSDHRLHKAAARRRATPVDSDVWYDRLLAGNVFTDEKNKTTGNPSLQQISSHPTDRPNNPKRPKDLPTSLEAIDWSEELDVGSVNLSDIEQELESSSDPIDVHSHQDQDDDSSEQSYYNPFPPGYGEDLIDED